MTDTDYPPIIGVSLLQSVAARIEAMLNKHCDIRKTQIHTNMHDIYMYVQPILCGQYSLTIDSSSTIYIMQCTTD